MEKGLSKLCSSWRRRAEKIRFFYEDWNPELADFSSHYSAVWEYYLEAGLSFISGYFVASILASSASVEVAINRDPRMKDEVYQKKHLTLSISTLKKARIRGLPVEKLLSSNESLDQGESVQFIDNRNKFAHGDIYLPANNMSAGPLMVIPKRGGLILRVAQSVDLLPRVQLQRAHDFLAALYADRAVTVK